MTWQFICFIILFIVNIILVVAYVLWQKKKKAQPVSYRAKATIMMCCPIVGPFFVALSYWIFKRFLSQEVDLADVIFSKARVNTYVHADEERGRNVVSMEEALAVTHKDNLRVLMMNVVRGDIQNSLASISLALNSEDTETSHYAASVLQDSLNDFRANVQKIAREIEENRFDQVDYICMLIDYMNPVLVQNVFTDMEQKAFVLQMEEMAELLYEKDAVRMTSHFFEAVSLRLLEIKEFEACEKWCKRAAEMYPNTLTTYTCQLKLYFSNENRDSFFRVLNELRASNVVIDNETLEMIRVFL